MYTTTIETGMLCDRAVSLPLECTAMLTAICIHSLFVTYLLQMHGAFKTAAFKRYLIYLIFQSPELLLVSADDTAIRKQLQQTAIHNKVRCITRAWKTRYVSGFWETMTCGAGNDLTNWRSLIHLLIRTTTCYHTTLFILSLHSAGGLV